MTMLAETNVTYTINDRTRIGKKYFTEFTMAFGDGALTYPTGGVPITPSKIGFRRNIDALKVIESNGNTLLYEWDKSANKLRIFSEARVEHTADSTAIAACSLEIYAIGW